MFLKFVYLLRILLRKIKFISLTHMLMFLWIIINQNS